MIPTRVATSPSRIAPRGPGVWLRLHDREGGRVMIEIAVLSLVMTTLGVGLRIAQLRSKRSRQAGAEITLFINRRGEPATDVLLIGPGLEEREPDLRGNVIAPASWAGRRVSIREVKTCREILDIRVLPCRDAINVELWKK